jgi:hypothetical protein
MRKYGPLQEPYGFITLHNSTLQMKAARVPEASASATVDYGAIASHPHKVSKATLSPL